MLFILGGKAIGFFGYLFTLITVWAHAKDCGRWGNVSRYMQWCYSKGRNTHTHSFGEARGHGLSKTVNVGLLPVHLLCNSELNIQFKKCLSCRGSQNHMKTAWQGNLLCGTVFSHLARRQLDKTAEKAECYNQIIEDHTGGLWINNFKGPRI